MRFIIFLILTLASSTALAQKEAAKIVAQPNAVDTGLLLADLSTSPTTDSMSVDSFSLLKLQVRFVGAGAATNVGCTCEESDDDITWSMITKIAPDDTVTQFHPLYTTGASLNFSFRLDVTLFLYVRCTFSGAGATGTDTVTVIAGRGRGI